MQRINSEPEAFVGLKNAIYCYIMKDIMALLDQLIGFVSYDVTFSDVYKAPPAGCVIDSSSEYICE